MSNTKPTPSEIKAERDFLLNRINTSVKNNHAAPDEVGISSNAMVLAAMVVSAALPDFCYPSDPSDLRRCENTYRVAPPHLQERMLPILQSFRRKVAERYPEVGCG